MKKASEGTPRKGDLTRQQLENRAAASFNDGWTIYFKFTCAHCGERCTFNDPNCLYEVGECAKCGKETEVDVGGFSLQRTV